MDSLPIAVCVGRRQLPRPTVSILGTRFTSVIQLHARYAFPDIAKAMFRSSYEKPSSHAPRTLWKVDWFAI